MNSIPRWALIAVGFLCLGAVGAIGTWAGTGLQNAIDTNHRQDADILVLRTEVVILKDGLSRQDSKLDRILERLLP
jgi:hypothetical protein